MQSVILQPFYQIRTTIRVQVIHHAKCCVSSSCRRKRHLGRSSYAESGDASLREGVGRWIRQALWLLQTDDSKVASSRVTALGKEQAVSADGILRAKIQIGIKFVPAYCVAGDGRCCPFTAKGKCMRRTCRENAHSVASAKDFLKKLVCNALLPIRMVQADNESELANAVLVTKFK